MYSQPYKKFIIFATPRSGTHMLRSSLMTHPNVVVHGEMFNPGTPAFLPYPLNETPDKILRNHIYHPFDKETHAVGFPIHDLQYFAPQNPHWSLVWDHLAKIDDLFIIRLRRQNLAEQFVSNVAAQHSGSWWLYYRKRPKAKPNKIYCKPFEMESYFTRLKARQAEIESKFSSHGIIFVNYEVLITDYHAQMKRIQDALGLTTMKLMPATTKQDRRILSDRLGNYYELKEYFEGTEYADYFIH
ncbi:MAG: hypothetical protein ABFS39_06870 [Pseudomonadota bacterium]